MIHHCIYLPDELQIFLSQQPSHFCNLLYIIFFWHLITPLHSSPETSESLKILFIWYYGNIAQGVNSTSIFSYLVFHINFVRYIQNTNRHFFIVSCRLLPLYTQINNIFHFSVLHLYFLKMQMWMPLCQDMTTFPNYRRLHKSVFGEKLPLIG